MTGSIEIRKLELQLSRVRLARQENELRVLELQENIARVEADIEISRAHEQKLEAEIKEKSKG